MVDIVNQYVIAVVAKEMLNVGNVMVEEVSDVRTAMMELSNVVLVVVYMRWIVQAVMDLERMKKVVNVQIVQVQELILVKNVVVKI